jgi:hypothetical protein
MSKLTRWFSSPFLLRAIVRELGGIRVQLQRQGDLLERFAAHAGMVSPAVVAEHAAPEDLADSGVSFLDGIERGMVEDYVAKTQKDTGRVPSDEEVLSYLADERTQALHARLTERAAALDLDRLGRKG